MLDILQWAYAIVAIPTFIGLPVAGSLVGICRMCGVIRRHSLRRPFVQLYFCRLVSFSLFLLGLTFFLSTTMVFLLLQIEQPIAFCLLGVAFLVASSLMSLYTIWRFRSTVPFSYNAGLLVPPSMVLALYFPGILSLLRIID